MPIFRFLGREPQPQTAADTETVRKIVDALDRLDPDRARYLAAFAYILSRAARADLTVSPEETKTMERIVAETGGLPAEQAVLVVQIAKTQNLLFGATENFLVTREFNKLAGREQKLALLHCLFAVSAADDSISGAEDNAVRQIARELNLEHSDFIAARSAFQDRLSVFKKPPRQG